MVNQLKRVPVSTLAVLYLLVYCASLSGQSEKGLSDQEIRNEARVRQILWANQQDRIWGVREQKIPEDKSWKLDPFFHRQLVELVYARRIKHDHDSKLEFIKKLVTVDEGLLYDSILKVIRGNGRYGPIKIDSLYPIVNYYETQIKAGHRPPEGIELDILECILNNRDLQDHIKREFPCLLSGGKFQSLITALEEKGWMASDELMKKRRTPVEHGRRFLDATVGTKKQSFLSPDLGILLFYNLPDGQAVKWVEEVLAYEDFGDTRQKTYFFERLATYLVPHISSKEVAPTIQHCGKLIKKTRGTDRNLAFTVYQVLIEKASKKELEKQITLAFQRKLFESSFSQISTLVALEPAMSAEQRKLVKRLVLQVAEEDSKKKNFDFFWATSPSWIVKNMGKTDSKKYFEFVFRTKLPAKQMRQLVSRGLRYFNLMERAQQQFVFERLVEHYGSFSMDLKYANIARVLYIIKNKATMPSRDLVKQLCDKMKNDLGRFSLDQQNVNFRQFYMTISHSVDE